MDHPFSLTWTLDETRLRKEVDEGYDGNILKIIDTSLCFSSRLSICSFSFVHKYTFKRVRRRWAVGVANLDVISFVTL